jgi:hypothetical protein
VQEARADEGQIIGSWVGYRALQCMRRAPAGVMIQVQGDAVRSCCQGDAPCVCMHMSLSLWQVMHGVASAWWGVWPILYVCDHTTTNHPCTPACTSQHTGPPTKAHV